LEAHRQNRIRVLNKIDLLPPDAQKNQNRIAGEVHVSARTGAGLDELLHRMDELLQHDPLRRVRLRIPQKEGKALSQLEAGARVLHRAYRDGSVQLEVQAPESLVRRLGRFVVSK